VYKKILIVFLLTGIAFSQQKIGVVFMEKIRLDYPGQEDVRAQLEAELQALQIEQNTMLAQLDSMYKAYEQQSLMISDDLKKAKQQEIKDMESEFNNWRQITLDPNGELARKQAQWELDWNNEVKEAITNVAIRGGFDLIIDGSMAALYAKPTINITDDILTELSGNKQTAE
jgi:outer membrane protein